MARIRLTRAERLFMSAGEHLRMAAIELSGAKQSSFGYANAYAKHATSEAKRALDKLKGIKTKDAPLAPQMRAEAKEIIAKAKRYL